MFTLFRVLTGEDWTDIRYNLNNFNSDPINISFNSKYLVDIASEVEDKNLKINLKDSVSPVLIQDNSDNNSYYVIMPMKI